MLGTVYSHFRLCTITDILRSLAYSEPCLLRHIQPFSFFSLTHLLPMHRKVFWCFQGVEKGCIGNEWVKEKEWFFSYSIFDSYSFNSSSFTNSASRRSCGSPVSQREDQKCFMLQYCQFRRFIEVKLSMSPKKENFQISHNFLSLVNFFCIHMKRVLAFLYYCTAYTSYSNSFLSV